VYDGLLLPCLLVAGSEGVYAQSLLVSTTRYEHDFSRGLYGFIYSAFFDGISIQPKPPFWRILRLVNSIVSFASKCSMRYGFLTVFRRNKDIRLRFHYTVYHSIDI